MRPAKLAIAAVIASLSGPMVADEVSPGIFQIGRGSEVMIDRHNVCRVVKNNGTSPLMIGASKAEEWSIGVNSFLRNISDIPGVTVANCKWWEGRKTGTAEFGTQGGHATQVTWKDGSTSIIQPDSTQYSGVRPNRPLGAHLPEAVYYNAMTGECAPRKSYIGVGPRFRFLPPDLHYAYIQLCDSDGMSTSPFVGLEDVEDEKFKPIDPYSPLPSFDRR